jgi:tRNA threonylcarbamoyladenosine biosynthesis protein TsaE
MSEQTIHYSLPTISSAATDFINLTKAFSVFAFHGQMGSGKTTFIKAVCEVLQCKETASSPTYSLVNEYYSELLKKKVYHADLYRIRNFEELLNIGFEDYLNGGECINFIEWPELAMPLLPADTVHIHFETVSNTERTIRIELP